MNMLIIHYYLIASLDFVCMEELSESYQRAFTNMSKVLCILDGIRKLCNLEQKVLIELF